MNERPDSGTLRPVRRKMTGEEARAFAARWEQVAEAEREELRATPIERKFAQLAAMMESARALDWKTTDLAEVEAVRRRWNQLTDIYRATSVELGRRGGERGSVGQGDR